MLSRRGHNAEDGRVSMCPVRRNMLTRLLRREHGTQKLHLLGRPIMIHKIEQNIFCRVAALISVLVPGGTLVIAQPADEQAELLRAGRTFLETRAYSSEEDRKVLQLFGRLRVADVSDGMD